MKSSNPIILSPNKTQDLVALQLWKRRAILPSSKTKCINHAAQNLIIINVSIVDQLQQFAQEVTKIAREVDTEGQLGVQATVHGVEGTWSDLTKSVNHLSMNLTTAVANGDLTKKVQADVQGEKPFRDGDNRSKIVTCR